MRTPLDADELAAALQARPGWSGTTQRISRTVPAPPAGTEELRRQVARVADELDHHPVLEDVPGGTRFVLWTHVRGAVTELDLVLADRIDSVVARLTGGDPGGGSAPDGRSG